MKHRPDDLTPALGKLRAMCAHPGPGEPLRRLRARWARTRHEIRNLLTSAPNPDPDSHAADLWATAVADSVFGLMEPTITRTTRGLARPRTEAVKDRTP